MAKQRHFIKEWRKHRGYNQEKLAERVGVNRSQISKWENGEREVNLSELEAVAEALRCDVVDLLTRDPTDPEGIWTIWDSIPPVDRPQARRVLSSFAKTGTND